MAGALPKLEEFGIIANNHSGTRRRTMNIIKTLMVLALSLSALTLVACGDSGEDTAAVDTAAE